MKKIDTKMITEAHSWLMEQKTINRLSYKEIGEVIGYSDTGVIKAFKKYTLKPVQIKLISEYFNLNYPFDSFEVSKVNKVSDKEKGFEESFEQILSSVLKKEIKPLKDTIHKLECEVKLLRGIVALKGKIDSEEESN